MHLIPSYMKKLLISMLLIIIPAIPVLHAQLTKIGGGAGFSTGYTFHKVDQENNKSSHFYGSLKGIYEISVPVHISSSITLFVPHVYKLLDTKTTVNTMMFDINGNYVFNSLDRFEFYALAGLDIMFAWKREKLLEITYNERENAPGLNLGAGTYMKITEQFDIYAEAKYILSKYGQFMFNAGILINLDRFNKHEDTGI